MKREVEMGVYDDGGKARVRNHRFIKGRSLPNPSIARQYSLKKIMKTLSLGSYELQSSWQQEKDAENEDYEHITLH